jgi:hypothetical protein
MPLMAQLKLKKFKCDEDTDEIGGESPYFLTFIADTRFLGNGFDKLPEVVCTRKASWNNQVDKGETWPVNALVTETFDLGTQHTMVLCAMVEKDEGLDISSDEIKTIRKKMIDSWTAHIQGGFLLGDSGLTSNLSAAFQGAINTALESTQGAQDDLMRNSAGRAIRRLTLLNEAGVCDPVGFSGDTGFYRVWYERT